MKKGVIPLILLLVLLSSVFAIEEIPSNSDDLRQYVQDQYLKQEWNSILSENKYFSPIHNFFIDNPLITIVPFAQAYSFSLTFILIFITWLYIFAFINDQIKNIKPLSKLNWLSRTTIPIVIGILVAIILAHLGIIRGLVTAILQLIYSQELWSTRAIIIAGIIIILYIIFRFNKIVTKIKEKREKARKEKKMKEDIEELKEIEKGLLRGIQSKNN